MNVPGRSDRATTAASLASSSSKDTDLSCAICGQGVRSNNRCNLNKWQGVMVLFLKTVRHKQVVVHYICGKKALTMQQQPPESSSYGILSMEEIYSRYGTNNNVEDALKRSRCGVITSHSFAEQEDVYLHKEFEENMKRLEAIQKHHHGHLNYKKRFLNRAHLDARDAATCLSMTTTRNRRNQHIQKKDAIVIDLTNEPDTPLRKQASLTSSNQKQVQSPMAGRMASPQRKAISNTTEDIVCSPVTRPALEGLRHDFNRSFNQIVKNHGGAEGGAEVARVETREPKQTKRSKVNDSRHPDEPLGKKRKRDEIQPIGNLACLYAIRARYEKELDDLDERNERVQYECRGKTRMSVKEFNQIRRELKDINTKMAKVNANYESIQEQIDILEQQQVAVNAQKWKRAKTGDDISNSAKFPSSQENIVVPTNPVADKKDRNLETKEAPAKDNRKESTATNERNLLLANNEDDKNHVVSDAFYRYYQEYAKKREGTNDESMGENFQVDMSPLRLHVHAVRKTSLSAKQQNLAAVSDNNTEKKRVILEYEI